MLRLVRSFPSESNRFQRPCTRVMHRRNRIAKAFCCRVTRMHRRAPGADVQAHPVLKALTLRQRAFVLEYVRSLDGSQAAIRAGCRARNPRVAASRLLRKPKVEKVIHRLLREREAELELSANKILQELSAVAFFDPLQLFDEHGNLKPIHTLDERTAKAISFSWTNLYKGRGAKKRCVGQLWKFRFGNRLRALEMLGKCLGRFNGRAEQRPSHDAMELLRSAS